ncbi:Sperm flagellar protein 1 [Mactra antiquata]
METITARREINGMTKVDMEEYFDDVEVESLYSWIDRIPLSRPKKNISKDFADGVLCAEVVKHYFPRMVDAHNYSPAANTNQKKENWYYLNKRVFKKLELDLSDDVLHALANAKPKVIERVLMLLRLQIDKFLEKTGRDARWRRKELYYQDPDPVLRLRLNTPLPHPTHSQYRFRDTPPDIKSPKGDNLSRSMSPNRLIKSEPASSPRKYNKGEIPHGHPDRTLLTSLSPYPFMSHRALQYYPNQGYTSERNSEKRRISQDAQ